VPCAQDPWLCDTVLRKEWGFDGVVVSDWSAAYDQVAALNAGNDLAMPGPRGVRCILKAVEEGKLPEEKVTASARRMLELILQMPVMKGRVTDFSMQEGLDAALWAAREGMILLKNNGVLPLDEATVRPAFYGLRSEHFCGSGAGSAEVETSLLTNPLQEMRSRLGENRVSYETAEDGTNVLIVTVGANGQEGADRADMEMDEADKVSLETAIAEAGRRNSKVVVILNTEGPVNLMPYIDRVDAVLCAFYPGMMGGRAAVEILLGDVNPSGRLPLTWPKDYRDTPGSLNFGGEGKEVWYGEGIFVGYRYFDRKHIAPLYPFGYGLSYTDFAVTDVKAPEAVEIENENVTVEVTVKNTGERDGAATVQLYLRDVVTRFEKPEKELKAFCKVFIPAGEEKTVTMQLCKEDFASYSMDISDWAVEPGEYEILIGMDAERIAAAKKLTVSCFDPFYFRATDTVTALAASGPAVKLMNEILGRDYLKLVQTLLVFMPAEPLEKAWKKTIAPALRADGLDEETIAEKYQAILEGFKTL